MDLQSRLLLLELRSQMFCTATLLSIVLAEVARRREDSHAWMSAVLSSVETTLEQDARAVAAGTPQLGKAVSLLMNEITNIAQAALHNLPTREASDKALLDGSQNRSGSR